MWTQPRPRGFGGGESGTPGRVGRRRTAHRGLLLEVDADTAARGVLERLLEHYILGIVVGAVALKTVNEEQSGYSERASLSAGAERKANTYGQFECHLWLTRALAASSCP